MVRALGRWDTVQREHLGRETSCAETGLPALRRWDPNLGVHRPRVRALDLVIVSPTTDSYLATPIVVPLCSVHGWRRTGMPPCRSPEGSRSHRTLVPRCCSAVSTKHRSKTRQFTPARSSLEVVVIVSGAAGRVCDGRPPSVCVVGSEACLTEACGRELPGVVVGCGGVAASSNVDRWWQIADELWCVAYVKAWSSIDIHMLTHTGAFAARWQRQVWRHFPFSCSQRHSKRNRGVWRSTWRLACHSTFVCVVVTHTISAPWSLSPISVQWSMSCSQSPV